jgi:hypothetical protein
MPKMCDISPLCPLPLRSIHGARSARAQGAACLETVRSEFKFVSQLLSDGRPFICGQQLTAADITFVALALPMLSVPYASVGPVCDPNVFTPPPDMAAVIAELRGVACPSLPSPTSLPSLPPLPPLAWPARHSFLSRHGSRIVGSGALPTRALRRTAAAPIG